MAKIRIGFIGLSKAGWAPIGHLPILKPSDKYEIVAICNTSVESAEKAIKLYDLPANVKAYGDPEKLAEDPNIDLVVCAVRVDKHLPTIAPSLKAGKDVYVEWPLAKSHLEALEILRLKNEGGVKNAMVGLQARQEPGLKLLKELVDSERIGKILSSTWVGQAWTFGDFATVDLEYSTQKENGGNLVTIYFGHSIDYVQSDWRTVLGYAFRSSHSLLANRRPIIKLVDGEGKVVSDNHIRTSEDTIFFQGTLESGIPLSMTLRGGVPFKGTPGLDWRIYGETGEIRITASAPFLNVGDDDLNIQLYDRIKDSVEEFATPEDEFGTYARPARNVGRLYKDFEDEKVTCTFEDAVERHALLERMIKQNDLCITPQLL